MTSPFIDPLVNPPIKIFGIFWNFIYVRHLATSNSSIHFIHFFWPVTRFSPVLGTRQYPRVTQNRVLVVGKNIWTMAPIDEWPVLTAAHVLSLLSQLLIFVEWNPRIEGKRPSTTGHWSPNLRNFGDLTEWRHFWFSWWGQAKASRRRLPRDSVTNPTTKQRF